MSDFGRELTRLMAERGIGVRQLARAIYVNPGHISNLRNGKGRPSGALARALDNYLRGDGKLAVLAPAADVISAGVTEDGYPTVAGPQPWELVGTLTRSSLDVTAVGFMESSVTSLAARYPFTPPADLIPDVQSMLGVVNGALGQSQPLHVRARCVRLAGILSGVAGQLSDDTARPDQSVAWFAAAEIAAAEIGDPDLTAWILALRSIGCYFRGEYAVAAGLLEHAGADAASCTRRRRAWVAVLSARAKAAIAVERDSAAESRGGVALEAPETPRRTASAGWYRTAAMAGFAGGWSFLNMDAFSDTAKHEVTKLLADRYGQVDYLIYSIAAPRRTDPADGITHHSVIKPLSGEYTAKTLEFKDGSPVIGCSTITAATNEERNATVHVMGGADWQLWTEALDQAGLLGDNFTTAALTYVGSDLTAAIYREGTIGAAKKHLEATAGQLDTRLGSRGRAFTIVAGAAVTQASTAIPSIALYISILHRVLGEDFQSAARQMTSLWAKLAGEQPLTADDVGRIRLDDWELDPAVQDQVRAAWSTITTETAAQAADPDWFREQVGWLYGWQVPGVDYDCSAETAVPWPAG